MPALFQLQDLIFRVSDAKNTGPIAGSPLLYERSQSRHRERGHDGGEHEQRRRDLLALAMRRLVVIGHETISTPQASRSYRTVLRLRTDKEAASATEKQTEAA